MLCSLVDARQPRDVGRANQARMRKAAPPLFADLQRDDGAQHDGAQHMSFTFGCQNRANREARNPR